MTVMLKIEEIEDRNREQNKNKRELGDIKNKKLGNKHEAISGPIIIATLFNKRYDFYLMFRVQQLKSTELITEEFLLQFIVDLSKIN